MTRPAKARNYPTQFFDLAAAICENKVSRFTIEFATPKEAASFRLEFYNFRGRAEEEGLIEEYPELSAITLFVEGSNVLVMHKDYTPNALAVTKALKGKT